MASSMELLSSLDHARDPDLAFYRGRLEQLKGELNQVSTTYQNAYEKFVERRVNKYDWIKPIKVRKRQSLSSTELVVPPKKGRKGQKTSYGDSLSLAGRRHSVACDERPNKITLSSSSPCLLERTAHNMGFGYADATSNGSTKSKPSSPEAYVPVAVPSPDLASMCLDVNNNHPSTDLALISNSMPNPDNNGIVCRVPDEASDLAMDVLSFADEGVAIKEEEDSPPLSDCSPYRSDFDFLSLLGSDTICEPSYNTFVSDAEVVRAGETMNHYERIHNCGAEEGRLTSEIRGANLDSQIDACFQSDILAVPY